MQYMWCTHVRYCALDRALYSLCSHLPSLYEELAHSSRNYSLLTILQAMFLRGWWRLCGLYAWACQRKIIGSVDRRATCVKAGHCHWSIGLKTIVQRQPFTSSLFCHLESPTLSSASSSEEECRGLINRLFIEFRMIISTRWLPYHLLKAGIDTHSTFTQVANLNEAQAACVTTPFAASRQGFRDSDKAVALLESIWRLCLVPLFSRSAVCLFFMGPFSCWLQTAFCQEANERSTRRYLFNRLQVWINW